MELKDRIEKSSQNPELAQRAIFNLLFMLTNRIQNLFDARIPEVTLRQFMLLSTLHGLEQPLSLGECGKMLGCSRQNVKKLALSLEKKGFVHIETNPDRPRALMILLTDKADACFDGAFAPYREQLGELFTGLNEDQTLALFEMLLSLLNGADLLEKAAMKAPDEESPVPAKIEEKRAENKIDKLPETRLSADKGE